MFLMDARMGVSGCRVIGWLRFCFGLAHLCDRLLLSIDLEFFLSPTEGILSIDDEPKGLFGLLSLLRFVGDSDYLLWAYHSMGCMHAGLLMLGIAPRLNAILLYINSCSFHFASWMICDGTAIGVNPLIRIFSLFFIFLPLHHVTIFDKFGRDKTFHQDSSWPMWPVWLFQAQSVVVMLGAMINKFDGDNWVEGKALYYISQMSNEGYGIFDPDILLNRKLPSKLLTWSALAVEVISPFGIWFEKTRVPTLIAVIMIFLGIDMTMNMGSFQVFNIIGWAFFLVRRDDAAVKGINRTLDSILRQMLSFITFSLLMISILSCAWPFAVIMSVCPTSMVAHVLKLQQWNDAIYDSIEPFVNSFGIYQKEWALYSGSYAGDTSKVIIGAEIEVEGEDGPTYDHLMWRTVTWNKLPKWKRKRYYNYLNYLNHIGGGEPKEQEDFLTMVGRDILIPAGLKLQTLALGVDEVQPLPYPDNVGWLDTLRYGGLEFVDRTEHYYVEFSSDMNQYQKKNESYSKTWWEDLFEVYEFERDEVEGEVEEEVVDELVYI